MKANPEWVKELEIMVATKVTGASSKTALITSQLQPLWVDQCVAWVSMPAPASG